MSPSSNRHRICNKKSIRLEKRNVSRHRPPSSSASEDVRSLPLASVLFLRQDLIAFTTAVVQSNLSNGKRSAGGVQNQHMELVGIWISRYYNDISVFFHEAGEIYSCSNI
uniref:Uncharacterized protein n=1 Tax=Oryza glumipatula TaxID=40148 RepID=A0A0E0B8W9_9ORYZ